MNWTKGNREDLYYAYCMIGEDNGILANKIDVCMQEKYGMSCVRCGYGKLSINNWSPSEPYNFYIYCVDEKALEKAMNDVENIYTLIDKTI